VGSLNVCVRARSNQVDGRAGYEGNQRTALPRAVPCSKKALHKQVGQN